MASSNNTPYIGRDLQNPPYNGINTSIPILALIYMLPKQWHGSSSTSSNGKTNNTPYWHVFQVIPNNDMK